MTETVSIGNDEMFHDASDGDSWCSGWGLGNREYYTEEDKEPPEAHVASQVQGAGVIGSHAEIWKDIYVSGSGSALAEIMVAGYWAAGAIDVGSGSELTVEAFVRDSSGDLDSNYVLNESGAVYTTWTDSDVFMTDLYAELEAGEFYEIGIRSTTASTAAASGAGYAIMAYTPGWGGLNFNGETRYGTIDIEWL